MVYLTIRQQDDLIKKTFPSFKLVFDDGWRAYWEGMLTPISQTYKIRIRLITRKYFDGAHLTNRYEKITVLDPPIGPDPRGTGEPPEHVYRFGHSPVYPALCVHDPDQDEWTPEMSIADVLIPMIVKWLVFHEDWVDAGVWRGGGRHPEPLPKESIWRTQYLSQEDRVLKEQSLNAAFHSLGRRLGVFGSYLSMGEEYVGYFPPPFWLNLRNDTVMAIRSEDISISSQEPPPEASSHLGSEPVYPLPNYAISMSDEEKRFSPNPAALSSAA
jgi:hypothetical protein